MVRQSAARTAFSVTRFTLDADKREARRPHRGDGEPHYWFGNRPGDQASDSAAWAAARRAIGTRNGLQLT